MFKLAVICGGPSAERGISLNSARSVMDHLQSDAVQIVPIYVDLEKEFYEVSPSQLYSNTPSDFDFKLKQTATTLTQDQLIERLKSVDLVFPAMHGEFGEDGGLQDLLERNDIPFVASNAQACRKMFNKSLAQKTLKDAGFYIPDSLTVSTKTQDIKQRILQFFDKNDLLRCVIKPAEGGSSIGVQVAIGEEEAIEMTRQALKDTPGTDAYIEPYAEGKEFTVIILQNPDGDPVALVPSEIEMLVGRADDKRRIFDYRNKYLPTAQVIYHTPPRFSDEVITSIQSQAEKIFDLFGMRDFVRIDGWVLDDGNIWFSDINPLSGMEQNSFLFQQGARVGMTHRDMLSYVVGSACKREDLTFPAEKLAVKNKEKIRILFGGKTAERQVSLMSGTNVWLKLKQSEKYDPSPYLLDKKGQIWTLPYAFTLNHTVEEIHHHCRHANEIMARLLPMAEQVRKKLSLNNETDLKISPQPIAMEDFLDDKTFVFLALHGGEGEDGHWAKRLEAKGIGHNGSGFDGAQIAMDKAQTGKVVEALGDSTIMTAPKIEMDFRLFRDYTASDFQEFWKDLQDKLKTQTFIIKPNGDGCSAGIVRLYNANELQSYVEMTLDRSTLIPPGTFTNQTEIIELSEMENFFFLVESFIETDEVIIEGAQLKHVKNEGWIELTLGVLEQGRNYYPMNPSITVAEGNVLSLEEKFQGGTGVNITPPPTSIVSQEIVDASREKIARVANAIGIGNYSRIDYFLNIDSGDVIVIEANSLPGLTPSTVIYHQALAETPSLYPTAFLEKLIELAKGDEVVSQFKRVGKHV